MVGSEITPEWRESRVTTTTPQNTAALTAHCVVLTISGDTSANHDIHGKQVESLLHEKGHEVVYRRMIKHTAAAIREAIAEALADEECEVIVTLGGTGLSHKDEAFETLSSLYEKRLVGFGELLTHQVFEETGSACLYARPSAGVIEGHPVFSLPLDPIAIRLGLEKLILPGLAAVLTGIRK